jgi:hypothetical protein
VSGLPVVVETVARGFANHRARCPQPHFDRDGQPVDGPAAFLYRELELGTFAELNRAVACRAHAPTWATARLPDPERRSRGPRRAS